jgi:hypothetical protein
MTAPAMILMRTPTWAKVLLAMMLGAVLMFGFSCYNDYNRARAAELKVKSDSLKIAVAEKDSALKLANAHVDTVREGRRAYTAAVLAGDRPAIPRNEVVELANKCTQVEDACALQQKAAQGLIDNLKQSLAVEQKRVALMPPRLKLGVEGGWNFTAREIPLRGRGELRIAGPISLVGEAQLRISDSASVKHDLSAFIHYTFR